MFVTQRAPHTARRARTLLRRARGVCYDGVVHAAAHAGHKALQLAEILVHADANKGGFAGEALLQLCHVGDDLGGGVMRS